MMLDERETEPAEQKPLIERRDHRMIGAWRKECVGVQKQQNVAHGGTRSEIHLPPAHAIALDHPGAAGVSHSDRCVLASSVGDDHLGCPRLPCRSDGGRNRRLLVPGGNDHGEIGWHRADGTIRPADTERSGPHRRSTLRQPMPAQSRSVNCYVLTGGLSRRMGAPKEGLRIGERSFIEAVTDAARGAFDEVIAVTRSDLPDVPGVTTIHEEPHARSAAAIHGLARALAHSPDEKAWVLGLDYPLVTPELLRFLREEFESDDAEIAIPLWKGKRQMLCAGYAAALRDEVDSRIRDEDFRLQSLIENRRVHWIEEAEIRRRFSGELLQNVNTPEDYELARRLYEQR